MRIVVISDLPHFVTGGAEMQASRLIEAWLDQGHEVICLGRRMGKGPIAIGRHPNVQVRRIRTAQAFGRFGRGASYAASLAWHLVALRGWMDVVYTRFLGEAAATAALLKQLGLIKAPLVATPANTRGSGDAAFLRGVPFASRVQQLLDRNCDAINLIAPEMDLELQEAGFEGDNFSHIPNGIPVTSRAERLPGTPPRFVSVGRLSAQKGYDTLLEALSGIRNKLTPGQFTILGDGPERDNLQALATNLRLSPYIVWAGELGQSSVRDHLEHADVFVLPSRYEGMSNAGLEAMERSLPVIMTCCGGLDRYVDAQMGWIVQPDDSQGLAAAIADAITTPTSQLQAMGDRARNLVAQQFDISVTAGRYIALFERLRSAKHEKALGR